MNKYVNAERMIAIFRDREGNEFKRVNVDDRMGRFPKNTAEYSLYKCFDDEEMNMIEFKVRIGSLLSNVNENNCSNPNLIKAAKTLSAIPQKENDGEYIYFVVNDNIIISQVPKDMRLVPSFNSLEASFIRDVNTLKSINSFDELYPKNKKI